MSCLRSLDRSDAANNMLKQENCAIAKMTARCTDKINKQPHLHLRSNDSIQLDVMDVGVEQTFSPQHFSMFPWE